MSERLHQLMQQIADEAASDAVRYYCGENNLWFRASTIAIDGEGDALEYLVLRNLIEYDSTGKLVRFVEPQS